MTTPLEVPLGPLLNLPDDALPAWALHTARAVGLGKIAAEYPEQFVRAAAAARTTLQALQHECSGAELADRPTWELT